MKTLFPQKFIVAVAGGLVASAVLVASLRAVAQTYAYPPYPPPYPYFYYPPPPIPPPNNAMAQRSALQNVQSQVGWFQNSLRNASAYQPGSYGNIYQQFQNLRGSYNGFRASLSSQQLSRGANDLAQLDAGLNIIQGAFSNYQQEVANGQSSASAMNDMCQVLYQASGVWLQELNRVSNRLRVGWN